MFKFNCAQCDQPLIRIDQYDAYACRNCLTWHEPKCSSSDCEFCLTRPDLPENINWDDPENTTRK